jgi:glycosyltransferase involved in cell wall biosynthesis
MKLFYCSLCDYGGWVSFTAHLSALTGWPIYKPGKVNRPPHALGYDQTYRVTKDFTGPIMITAIDKNYHKYLEKFPEGTIIVIHDPTELKADLMGHLRRFKIVTIRKTVHDLLKSYGYEPTLLLHPFYNPEPIVGSEKSGAVSISRIDYDKHIEIILEANKTLEHPIKIYGRTNARYIFHKLQKSDFEAYYCGSFPKTFSAVQEIVKDKKFVVDMSTIKNDGGGTQYTFLEAIAADCALILNRGWLVEGGDFKEGYNCLAVSNGEELAKLLSSEIDISEIKKNARPLLERHTVNAWKELASELTTHT